MACSVLAAGGMLTIAGDGASDHIVVRDHGDGTVDGSATGYGDFSASGITGIVIDSGAGDDHVSYNLVGDLQAGITRGVEVNMRDGNDHFDATVGTIDQAAVLRAGSELLMKVVGEHGNDQILFDAPGVTMDHATMKIAYYGGLGNDDIRMNYSGLVDHGGVSFFAFGNEENDIIRLSMVADPASDAPAPGGFRGIVDAGEGNDGIFYNLAAPSAVSTDQTSIDGGGGIDHALTNLDAGSVSNVENLQLV